MSRAERQAEYRAEVERLEDCCGDVAPNFSKVPRDVWVAGMSLPEAKRGKLYAGLLDAFFTGVDPEPYMSKDVASVYRSIKPRIRKARGTALGIRSAQKARESDLFSAQKRTKNDPKTAGILGAKTKPKTTWKTTVENAALPANISLEPNEVDTYEPSEVPSEVLTTNYKLQTTANGKPNPLRFGVADWEKGNKLDTQPNLKEAGNETANPLELFTEPTPEQVQGWWSDDGYSWATSDEGKRAACEFIEERKRRGIPERRGAASPFQQLDTANERKKAWRGLASVFAGSYERRRIS